MFDKQSTWACNLLSKQTMVRNTCVNKNCKIVNQNNHEYLDVILTMVTYMCDVKIFLFIIY